MTHGYQINATTLFAALNGLDRSIIGCCMQRHRHQAFIRFLSAIKAEVPKDKAVHVILDNYVTLKHLAAMKWLARHTRFTFHFISTSASWINADESLFAKRAKERLERGIVHSLVALQAAINRFLNGANAEPKPFRWTEDLDATIAAVRRYTRFTAAIKPRKRYAA